jgi:very-short-patch-repair endonuclease
MAKVMSVRSKLLRDRARQLRASSTEAESYLWDLLRNRRLGGWKWRRQAPVGPFIADFLCEEVGLVAELDGYPHDKRAGYDARRTSYLETQGLRVLRFWNNEVLCDPDRVCATLLSACGGDRPGPAAAADAEATLCTRIPPERW